MANKKVEEAPNTGLRALVFLMLALVAGGAATVTVYQLVESYKAQIAAAQRPEETQMVIVAAADLYPGLTITEQDIVGVNVPIKYLPEETERFTSHELVVGRIPRERILANEFIRPGRLANGETGIGLNALIDPGMRALSINIANGKAVSGFLNPKNLVDILVTLTGEDAGAADARQTITLLQAVPVLAVNARMVTDEPPNPDPKKKKKRGPRASAPSVTLLITPEQAEAIAHAERTGSITLLLRGDNDTMEVTTDSVTKQSILGEPVPEPVTAKPKPKKVVPKEETTTLQIIRGGQKETKTVGSDGVLKR